MAGDWIKMRVDLGDDPAVVLIAARLDAAEDEVVGKLHRLWSWADRHTTDGLAPAITPKWVDRYVGRTGFAEAMAEAGWISFTESGVRFPNFDRHNGESAKRRGEAAIRQRLSRKNRDEGVTGEARTVIPRPFVRHVMERDAYTCVYCGEASDASRESSRKAILSIDHIVPVTRGGTAAVDNLACCCRLCNGEKNDRTPAEWGINPTFLQPGVRFEDNRLVTDASQEKRDNSVTREEKKREEKKSGAKAPSFCADAPDWVPAEQWASFVQMRKAMRNVPFTEAAAKGVIAELRKLADAGHDPADLLQTAVTNGWRTVYPPKVHPLSPPNRQEALEQRNREVGDRWIKENFV